MSTENDKDESWGLILPLGAAAPAVKKWIGTAPTNCDLCGNKLHKVFVDGKTARGPWGIMCIPCFSMDGAGLGLGLGQKYNIKTLEKLKDKRREHYDE